MKRQLESGRIILDLDLQARDILICGIDRAIYNAFAFIKYGTLSRLRKGQITTSIKYGTLSRLRKGQITTSRHRNLS